MKAKVFQLRLSQSHLPIDQTALNTFLESVKVQQTATHFLNSDFNAWSVLVFYEDGIAMPIPTVSKSKSSKISYPANTPLTPAEDEQLQIMKKWRSDKARIMNVPEYIIITNAELVTLIKTPVQTITELYQIKGLGKYKISNFGEEMLLLLERL